MSEIDRIFRFPDVTGRRRPPGLVTNSAEFSLWQFLQFSGMFVAIRRWLGPTAGAYFFVVLQFHHHVLPNSTFDGTGNGDNAILLE